MKSIEPGWGSKQPDTRCLNLFENDIFMNHNHYRPDWHFDGYARGLFIYSVKPLNTYIPTRLQEFEDIPLYYESDQLVQVCKTMSPKSELFRSALLNGGFKCSGSHCNPKAIKTNAPLEFIWDIVRSLVSRIITDKF